MGQKVAGTCYVKVDGVQVVVSGDVEVPLGKVERDTIVKGYFSEKDLTPKLKVEILVTKDTPVEKIASGTNMTITAELAVGRVYVLSGAYLVGAPDYNSGEGKVSLEFHGNEGDYS